MSPYLGYPLPPLTVSTSAFQTRPSVTVTCTEGKWNKQVACEPVDCGVPDQHHVYAASFSCLEGTTFGSKCSFQCRHPAQLKGTEGPLAGLALPPVWEAQSHFQAPLLGLTHQGGFYLSPDSSLPSALMYMSLWAVKGKSRCGQVWQWNPLQDLASFVKMEGGREGGFRE